MKGDCFPFLAVLRGWSWFVANPDSTYDTVPSPESANRRLRAQGLLKSTRQTAKDQNTSSPLNCYPE